MAIRDTLFRFYEHYVREPDSRTDVYGYWVFILGYIIGLAGIFAFVVSFQGGTDSYGHIRVSGITASAGLALCLFGIVLMLPVRRRGIQASAVGLFVALLGVASFGVVYPNNWRELGMGLHVEVIAIYALGIGLIAGVTALVPIVTGRKGLFVDEEEADDPPILTGDSLEGAQFAVFRDENGDWRWHVLHLEALAESVESSATRPDARGGIERVKSEISSAGLLELTTSAFRLYEDREENWQWTLAREDGSVVASCAREYDDRDGAEGSVSFLKDQGPDADVIDIEEAAFRYTQKRDQWYWTLIDDGRRPLASGDTGYETQADAEESAETFVTQFEDARVLDYEYVGVELHEADDDWRWRFVDESDDELAASTDAFDGRRDSEAAVEALVPELQSASILVAGDPTYELYESESGWCWRLVDENGHVVAENPSPHTDRPSADHQTDRFATSVSEAEIVDIEDAEYEVFPTEPADDADSDTDDADEEQSEPIDAEPAVTSDGGVQIESAEPGPDWNWRLVTDDREIVAASTEPHDSAETATAAIERVREQASEADLIEFEHAAFQVYEADSGEWRWRLIDEDGTVLADSGEEHTSRSEAAEAMVTLKEKAPDAELLEIDTAAFELFVDEDDRWGWRLIDEAGKLVAEDPATHPTREAARAAMDSLLEELDADVRTMDRAIFQTYADDDWRWRFVLPNGDVVAVDSETHATRDELIESLGPIRQAGTNASAHTVGDVAVQVYGTDEWRWRLLDRDRDVLATASVSYDDRDVAIEAVRELQRHVTDAPVFTIETAAIRLEATTTVPATEDEDAVTDDTLENDTQWHWELVDHDRNAIARSVDAEATTTDVTAAIDDVRRLAPLANRVNFDVASFEVFADDEDRWRWRLLDEDGREVAVGSETYDSNDAAREGLADVRELIEAASILEIDSVSFELHAAGDGWKWRLVDEYGTTMSESTRTYESRTDARAAMNAVKDHAPEGWITFTEN